MATYIWTGLNFDGDITAVGNWQNGNVPVGGSDTKVVIGHNPYYPDHPIYSWPSGGHFDMEISTFYLSPSWGPPGDSISSLPSIIIGSESTPLQLSKTRTLYYGGFEYQPSWDSCPMNSGSETYLHIEQWESGLPCRMHISGYMEGETRPHQPRWLLNIKGTLSHVWVYKTEALQLDWVSTETNIAGTTATKAQNGPLKYGDPLGGWIGSGNGATNSKLTFNWQSSVNGGNPIKDCFVDLKYSTLTVTADDYEEGNLGCLSLSSTYEPNSTQLEDGNIYYLRGVGAMQADTTPIAIPTLELVGGSNADTYGIILNNTTKCYIQSGITVGGQSTGTGFKSIFFDTIFTRDINSSVTLKSGLIRRRSRIDASTLSPSQFTILDEEAGTGVLLKTNRGGWGWDTYGPIKIKPPMNSNIRIA